MTDPTQDASSPYYLHPSETPSLTITPNILEGQNYHQWSCSVRMSLISKNKIGFIDGSIQAPARTNALYSAWERNNMMVVSWLHKSLSPPSIRDELDVFRPLSPCTCAIKCTCAASISIGKYKSQDQVIKFLRGLNDNYSTVKTQILLMDPLPPLNHVFSLVVQEERQFFGESKALAVAGRGGSFRNNNGRGVAFGASGKGNITQNKGSYGRGNNTKVCSHCGKVGHTIDTCYRKHGFPPHFKFKNQNHDLSLANAVSQVDNPDDDEQDVAGPKANMQSQQFGFTIEQYQGLLTLL
ncbi:uncharacterized protein LOC109807015 [Cajanus cajan]|uniref:uncharacterized protein LOC109807015 n=1 Tax=Cajanus cajan TaxID=3821 RepID=UPI00098D756F|nr:uncharacterized protein LOC109807015 [Cajanus cajan]